MKPKQPNAHPTVEASEALPRRAFLGASLATSAAFACAGAPRAFATPAIVTSKQRAQGKPVLVGSRNGLPGMERFYSDLQAGAEPLDVALEVVKVVEADPNDKSVGLGGLPNEDGVVTLDAAVMHGPTHNSGAVACIENILHPCEVARLVMERTDHCLLVDRGAYRFAREHGHPHTELLTDETRRIWLRWRAQLSDRDDRLAPTPQDDDKDARVYLFDGERVAEADLFGPKRPTGTIHCSALSTSGEVACTTTTSGLAWKVPGRVGDSPIVGAGLYCDADAGSAGGTGRGESAILANASFAIVELMRQGAAPQEAGLEVLQRVTRQAHRAAAWQPGLVNERGVPTFNLNLYIVGLDGTFAGVTLKGKDRQFAVAEPEGGPRSETLVSLHG